MKLRDGTTECPWSIRAWAIHHPNRFYSVEAAKTGARCAGRGRSPETVSRAVLRLPTYPHKPRGAASVVGVLPHQRTTVNSEAAAPSAARVTPRSFWRRWFRRKEPSAFQRCLAIHIHYAKPRSALD